MDINLEKGTVTLFGKTGKLDTLIKKFTMLSGEQAYHFLINRGIQLPRKMNCLALMSVLNKRIKFLNSSSLSKDYFERLKYYSSFSEQQLYNLFIKICNDENAFYEYRYNLFQLILINFVAMDFSDGELNYIKSLKKTSLESFEQYFNYISGAALEQEDTFDGQNKAILFENLENSASSQEILDIAGKYGIDIPQTLDEEQYYDYIIWYMMQQGTYNDEIAISLKEMDINQLETFAKRTNVNMTINLGKKEYINYLIYCLDKGSQDLTSIKRFDIPEIYLPLSFTIDLKAVTDSTEPVRVIHYKGEEDDTEEFNQVLVSASEALELDETLEDEEESIDELIPKEPVEELSEEELANRALEAVLDDVVAQEFVDAVYEEGNKQSEPEQEEIKEETEEVLEENSETEESSEEENLEENQEPEQEVFKENDFDEAPSLMLNEDLSNIEAASDEEIQQLLEQNEASSWDQIEEAEEVKKDENFDTKVIKNEDYGSEKLVRLGNQSTAKTVFLAVVLGILVGLLIFILVALLR